MKKILLLICLVLGTLPMHADESNFLWLHTPSISDIRSLSLDDLQKITFSEEQLYIYQLKESLPLVWPYTKLMKITFENSPTTLVNSSAKNWGITIHCTAGEINVRSSEPLCRVCLYNMQGMCLAVFGQGDMSANYLLWSLPDGIYVVHATTNGHSVTRRFLKY